MSNEPKLLGFKLRSVRRWQLVLMLIWAIIFLFEPLWWRHHVRQREHWDTLYSLAAGGDLESVGRLAEQGSAGIMRLEKLASDPNAFSDARVAAINELLKKPASDPDVLVLLLRIDQPLAVRHAASEFFVKRGCDRVCESAAIEALNDIWKGKPTLEMRLSAQHPSPESARIDLELHQETEHDYLQILNRNPCATREILNSSYSADAAFITRVQAQLGRC